MTVSDHSVILHLAPELRSGLIKYMAKHDLDKQYAVLSLFLKSMRSEGLITQEVYDVYFSRYSKTVTSMSSNLEMSKLSGEQLQEKQKLNEKTRMFRAVLEQWGLDHKAGWKHSWIEQAKEWKMIPEARQIIGLGEGQQ